ncbi:MAG: AAA family ATPase [Candidatus Thiodiazotropha sp. 6PLUC4]
MKMTELTQRELDTLPTLHEGQNFRLRIKAESGKGRTLIIKSLKSDAGARSEERLVNEYLQTADLHLPGIRHPQGQLLVAGRPALALDYIEGKVLSDSHVRHRHPLLENLEVAIALTTVLERLHQQQLIHRNLASDHIIVSLSPLKVTLIGFGDAIIENEHEILTEADLSSSMLAYISPEQTGRINRQVDHRTDLYSLGAVLYEVFTGKAPFEAEDAADQIYSHLARNPLAPEVLNSGVPEAISNLILRLLAKNPDQRYQSAYGVEVDLKEIRQQLQQAGRIGDITLGIEDYSSSFQLPEQIYGREEELKTLQTAVSRTSDGSGSLVLISGRAGIGKTALVEALRPFSVDQEAYFIVGSCESSQRHLPYVGLRQAFDEWIDLILTGSTMQLAQWKDKLLKVSGGNIDRLLDIPPRLKLIISTQPSAPEVDPSLVQPRFHHLLRSFVLASAQQEHPLILFLDNLQWADHATLELLGQLLPGIDSLPIVFIAAYRDDEVGKGHPLAALFDNLTAKVKKANPISLKPLTLDSINHLIADALKADAADTISLAQLVLEKSSGNPLFIRQFLQSLHENGQLVFEADRHHWSWDNESVRQQVIISSAAEIMAESIGKLPEDTRSTLALAACFDSHFLARSLASLAEISEAELAERLQPAVEAGLLQITESVSVPNGDSASESEALFGFTHDRVHQAAYAQLPLKQRRLNHLRIGRLLLNETPNNRLEDFVFEITDQFNEGFQHLKDEHERRRLVDLNLMAGRKARREAAYQASIRYLSMGIGLLSSNRWEDPEEPALELFIDAIEAEYLSANFERAALLSKEVLKHTSDLFTRQQVYELSILFLTAQNQNHSAIDTGLTALGELGISLTQSPSDKECQQLAALTSRVESLAHLPVMNNSRHLASLRIMMHLAVPALRINPNLLQTLIGKMVLLSAEHGNSPIAAFAYGWYGALLCGNSSDIETGYRFGRLSLEILQLFPAAELRTRVSLLFNAYVRHWKEPIQKSISQLQITFQQGMEAGDLEYTSLGAVHHCGYLLYTGESLGVVHNRLLEFQQTVEQWRLPFQGLMLRIWLQTTANLSGSGKNPTNLSGDFFDETNLLPAPTGENNNLLVFAMLCSRTLLQYLFGDFSAAVATGQEAEKYSKSALGLYYRVSHCYHYALALLALHETVDDNRRAECLEIATPLIDQLRRWAALSESNFSHYLALVEAEQARAMGNNGRAMELYSLAGRLAQENGRSLDIALVSEREAAFYRALGREDFAGLALRKAVESYRSWGALRKVEALEHHIKPQISHESSMLDMSAVLKASHMLSQEVHLQKLLERLMRIVIENAGAEQGLLIQSSASGLIIQARGDTHNVETMQAVAVEKSSEVPLSVINFVARTQNEVVLGNAHRDLMFGSDSYIAEHQTRSLLCLPIVYQGKLSGLPYLENNLSSDVFTLNHLELLKALASQAAISIENATLYAELENKIAELRESEQKFRVIFDETFQFIGVIDVNGKLLQANRTSLQFAGIKSEQVVGKDFWDTPWWTHSTQLQKKLKRAVQQAAKGNLVRFEATHTSPDGQPTYVDFSVKPVIDDEGKVVLLIPEGRDITERKKAEDELMRYKEHLEVTVEQRTEELRLARDEAESANTAKSTFLANMSHELRTPLNAILGFSHMMQRDKNLSKDQHETLNIINNSGEHLLKLINDVLEIAKIEAGKLQLDIATFDLHILVREVSDMMGLRAQQKGLQLALDQSSDFPRYIKGDEARLRQILVNLVSNAVKFTDDGGVTIRLGIKDNNHRHLIIEVKDTGPGISKADQEKLFEPFEQLHEGKMQIGTGLGLSIVQHTIKLMQGEITIESDLGKGSLFHVELPLTAAEETEIVQLDDKSQGEVIGLAAGEPSYRILIAEDQRDNQLLLVKLMRNINMKVKVANNGEECVEIFKQWKPDLIWMDRRMPVMDGVEATRRIRHMRDGKQVRIVAVTASAFKEQEPELIDAGIDDYIRKPFLIKDIYESLAQQLGLKFIYRKENKKDRESQKILTPQLLHAISEDQREALRLAVVSLDSDSINAIISRIAATESELGQVLSRLANEFDYPTILSSIEALSEKE